MDESEVYGRLELATSIIARHPDFPEKPAVVARCLKEIDERVQNGELSQERRDRLRTILSAPATLARASVSPRIPRRDAGPLPPLGGVALP